MERAGIVTDLDIFTPDHMARSAFYQDFLGKHGLAWFAGLGFHAAGTSGASPSSGRARKAPFSQQNSIS